MERVNLGEELNSRLEEKQKKDPFCSLILEKIKKNDQGEYTMGPFTFRVKAGTLMARNNNTNIETFVAPTEMVKDIVTGDHNATHYGRDKTFASIKKNWYFPNMEHRIDQIIKNCFTCQEYSYNNRDHKAAKPVGHIIPKRGRPGDCIAIDLWSCG